LLIGVSWARRLKFGALAMVHLLRFALSLTLVISS